MLKEPLVTSIKNKDFETTRYLLGGAEDMEILHTFIDLTPQDQTTVFLLLEKSCAQRTFEHLDTKLQQNLLRSLEPQKTIELVNALAPDDRIKLLDGLPENVSALLISSLSEEEREVTNVLKGYKSETAGHIMTPEYIALQKDISAAQALEEVRRQAKDKETVYTLFVTDSEQKLRGVLSLQALIVAESDSRVEDIMLKKPIRVSTDTDQEEVAKILQNLDLLAIPVVDAEERLVGIVTIDDAVDILEKEATEDIYDHAGLADVTNNESSRSEVLVFGSLWKIWKVRLPILLITLGVGMLSGLVINGFEQTLESIAVVAIFIPVIMGMGGNVGTQSSTVFVRGVVLGHIQLKNFTHHFLKEIGIGFSISAVIGVFTGIIAALWQGMPELGMAVGLALIVTITIASLLGFLVPFLLIKLKVDQAAGSAPIVTSIKDVVALVIYFLSVNIFIGNMGGLG